jgi:tetratricopeptide (TPR) repeat protein
MTPRSILCALLFAHASANAAGLCGELTNAYGPFDYRKGATEHAEALKLVEHGHFSEEVEAGIRGKSSTLGGDLDYALRAFPNHTRVLTTLSRVALQSKRLVLPGARYPVECYFDRAIRFAPDDGAVRAIYASYLYGRGQVDVALAMYEKAYSLDPLNPTINYNLGLTYAKQKQFDKSNLHAQRAYALGFPLPGLKNMLVAAGKWDDTVDHGIAPKPAEAQAEAEAVPEAAKPADVTETAAPATEVK